MSDLTWWKTQAGRWPLLTAEQEIIYGSAVRLWLDDPKPDQAVIRRGKRARERLVQANLRLVISIVTRNYAFAIYPRGHNDPQDLIQEANIGLNRAAEKYDPAKGYRFTTYAYWWIRQSINRWLSTHSRVVALPGHFSDEVNKLKKYREDLRQELGREPQLAEVADRAEMTVERMQEILNAWRMVLSLEHQLSETLVLGDTIAAPDPDQSDEHFGILAERMAWRLQDLNEEQREIIEAGFGLGEREIEKQTATADRMGMKRSRLSTIKKRALEELRQERRQRAPAEPADWEDVEVSPLPGSDPDPHQAKRLKHAPTQDIETFADRVAGQLGIALPDSKPLPDVGSSDERSPPIVGSGAAGSGSPEDLNLAGESINRDLGDPLLPQQDSERRRPLIKRKPSNLCSSDTQLQIFINV